MAEPTITHDAPRESRVVTRAVTSAAKRLGIAQNTLAGIIGVSPATISRLVSEERFLTPGSKSFELALLLIRLYRSLNAICGGDDSVARAWLANPNTALNSPPIHLLTRISGLSDVIHYLDSRRAVI